MNKESSFKMATVLVLLASLASLGPALAGSGSTWTHRPQQVVDTESLDAWQPDAWQVGTRSGQDGLRAQLRTSLAASTGPDGHHALHTRSIGDPPDEAVSSASSLEAEPSENLLNDAPAASSVPVVQRRDAVDLTAARGAYYDHIQPTKTLPSPDQYTDQVAAEGALAGSGEAERAPRGLGRALSLPAAVGAGPESNTTTSTMASTTTSSPSANSTSEGRDTASSGNGNNSDRVRDIITGIVKLLNGNVNVAPAQQHTAGSAKGGRPLRPMGTRINNRGPPRITDVPPLPPLPTDFEKAPLPPPPAVVPMPPPLPAQAPPQSFTTPPAFLPIGQSTRIPPPYPFDIPDPVSPSSSPSASPAPLPPQVQETPDEGPAPRPPPSMPIPIPISNPHKVAAKPTPPTPPPAPPAPSEAPMPSDEPSTKPNNARPKPTPTSPPLASPPIEKPVPSPSKPQSTKPTPPTKKDRDKEKMKEKEQASPDVTILQISTASSTQVMYPTPSSSSTPSLSSSSLPASSSSSSPTPSSATSSVSASASSTSANTTSLPGSAPTPRPARPAGPVLESSIEEVAVTAESAKPTQAIPSTPSTSSSAASTPTPATSSTSSSAPSRPQPPPPPNTGFGYRPYRPRPGLVLDDTEYKPGRPSLMTSSGHPGVPGPHIVPQVIPHPMPGQPHYGEVFDVTVSAVQGPGMGPGGATGQAIVYPVEIEGVQVGGAGHGDVAVITSAQAGQHFVSIDGKRTYINLFNTEQAGGAGSVGVAPVPVQPPPQRTGFPGTVAAGPSPSASTRPPVAAHPPGAPHGTPHGAPHGTPPLGGQAAPVTGAHPPRRPYKRPSHPPVRIDTCIVGDDSTCDAAQNEMCRTEVGVSACHCRPGYSRRKHREPCRRIVSLLMSLRVDRMYDRRLDWTDKFQDPQSDEYQQLEYESILAIDSAMSMTPFSDEFLGARVNRIFLAPSLADVGDVGASPGNASSAVFVNATVQLEEAAAATRPNTLAQDIQRHVLGVLHRRHNNVGSSALWVDAPTGAVQHLRDLDECADAELNDCHAHARCTNVFGSFRCACADGLRDPWAGNPQRSGRQCEACPAEYCNHRGECRFDGANQVCQCTGNFYGTQCEVDGEVLGVAVGASVAAVVIIVLTLVCLCMWSRRWSREQKSASNLGYGSPVFGYLGGGGAVKTPAVGAPPYQVTLEERLRWAQIADAMAQVQASNHYAPEPVGTCGATRPSSALFGYPSLSMAGTLPASVPVPLPRLSLNQGPLGSLSAYGTVQPMQSLAAYSTLAHTLKSQREREQRSTRTMPSMQSMQSMQSRSLPEPASSSSEEEDRTDLLGRNFQVPRPKSRSSLANQSGIYYDVDYETQGDMYGTKPSCIPMSTYSSRQHFHR